MKNKKALLEERGSTILTMTPLAEAIQSGTATDEQRTQFDALHSDLEKIDKDLLLHQRSEQVLKREKLFDPNNRESNEIRSKFSISKMVMDIANTGKAQGFEAEIVEESRAEGLAIGKAGGGFYLSEKILDLSMNKRMLKMLGLSQRTMTVGTLADGGYFVPTEKLGFFDALYAMTVFQNMGIISLTGLSANTDLPGFTTGVTTGWAAENGTQSPSTPVVANRALRPHLLYAACDISKQLLIQTNDSVDAYVMVSIIKAMAAEFEKQVINGDGSNKPTGILGTANIQSVAIGTNGGAPTLAKILALETAVLQANANGNNCHFLTNFAVANKAKQVSIDAGSGAMIMSYQAYFQGTPNVIDGKLTYLTSNVPSTLDKGTATGVCSALIFGDFSNLVTAQFGGTEISVDSTSAAIVRVGKVAITANQFVDSAILQPAAMGAIQDITTT